MYRFKVYRDWDGELTIDANYKLEYCKGVELNEENWVSYVTWYSGESLEIKNLTQEKESKCRLSPIYPAFGGEQWEIIKEKNEQ